MPVIQNELFDEPFTAVELTNAINRLPFTAPSLDPQFTWTTTLSLTTSVRLHMTNGKVEIAPYVPRGGVPPVFQGSKRSALQVEIPAIAGRASAHNREALNATAGVTGETRLLTLETLRDEKAKVMAEAIDQGEARQCAEAVKGLITDPDNARTVVDLYALQGKEQIEVDLDLTGGKSLNDQIEEIKEISEQKLGGIRPDSFKLITGDEASKIIRKNKEFKELLTDPLSNYLAKVDGRKSVAINDNVELVPYKNSLHWEADDAFLVPIYSGHAQIVYGPHESDEFWGQVLPRYSTSEPMPHGKGLEMEAWSYVLRYFQHPEAILKINVFG